MINITVSDMSRVQRELAKELAKLTSDKFVTVGIHESSGVHDGGITNAQLGAVQHFGSDNIPPRPWLDVGVATGNAEYLNIIKNGIAAGENVDDILERVGVVAAGKTQQYMTELNSPQNAQSTIDKKGSANPLIDTGELRQSVGYEIQTGKPKEGIE